jgi:hypothetical protein
VISGNLVGQKFIFHRPCTCNHWGSRGKKLSEFKKYCRPYPKDKKFA